MLVFAYILMSETLLFSALILDQLGLKTLFFNRKTYNI